MALNSHDMSWNSFLHTCIIYLLQTEFHSCCSHSTCWYRSFSVQRSPKTLHNMVGIDALLNHDSISHRLDGYFLAIIQMHFLVDLYDLMVLDFAPYPYFHTCLQPVASSNIKFTFRDKALWENLLFLENNQHEHSVLHAFTINFSKSVRWKCILLVLMYK